MLVDIANVAKAMRGHLRTEDFEDIIDEIVLTHHKQMVEDYRLKSLRLIEQVKQSVMKSK